jgi:hypothetical protein
MMLAEILDKMPTILGLWVGMFLMALPIFAISMILPRRLLFVGWVLAVSMSLYVTFWAVHEAFFEGGFSEAVWREMGGFWVFNSITASACSLYLMALSHWLHVRFPKMWMTSDKVAPLRDHSKPIHFWP